MIDALLGDESVLDIHPYSKWTGAHWRLVSLVELGVDPAEPRLEPMVDHVLRWLTSTAHRRAVKSIDGRVRRCASQEGNALAVASRLGFAGDDRVRLLASSLVEWQWPDGGWNCDKRPSATHSSFHETHSPIWGLHEYAVVTGDRDASAAAARGAELLLSRCVYKRRSTGEPVHKTWMVLHQPVYWHYDFLQGLVVLARLGMVGDERASDALDLLERRRLPDGRWRPGAYWWRPSGDRARDAVGWARSQPCDVLTAKAQQVLTAAGR